MIANKHSSQAQNTGRKKIAIVGSGISGLVAAYKLHPKHDIQVFEARDRIGGHTHTVTVELEGETQHVDTGFIVFNKPNYPNFLKLIEEINVPWQETDMSFSVKNDQTGIEWRGSNLNTLFAQRRNIIRPQFIQMFRDICRFNQLGKTLIKAGLSDEVTVDAFVSEHRFSNSFADNYLLPLSGALWSTPCDRIRQFPIRFILDFLHHHQMLRLTGQPVWRVIKGGSNSYINPLTNSFKDRIHLNSPVKNIRRFDGQVQLEFQRHSKGAGHVETFDHVIQACHSDQALKLLEKPTETEKAFLSAFPYERNDVALHTDASVLPRRKRAWASWNYHFRKDDKTFNRASVTYQMNILQNLKSRHLFNVTLNDLDGIDKKKIIRTFVYHHPLYTRQRQAVQRQHDLLIQHEGVSYCGAYWGFGFHEDGVKSALRVVQSFENTATPQPIRSTLQDKVEVI